MFFRIFVGGIEIAAAAWCGRLAGSALGTRLNGIVSTNGPRVRATVRIVRFTIAYLAIATMTWTLALSNLALRHQVALVILAALVGGGTLTAPSPTIGE